MVIININGNELEFKKEHVEKFESIVRDSFEEAAELYLLTSFHEKSIKKIFAHYSKEEIMECILQAAEEEIKVYSGEL